jgi:hypothetical protein
MEAQRGAGAEEKQHAHLRLPNSKDTSFLPWDRCRFATSTVRRSKSVCRILKRKGHATSTLRNIRATFSTVLQSAVERGFLAKNPAHGIRIREADTKKERRF